MMTTRTKEVEALRAKMREDQNTRIKAAQERALRETLTALWEYSHEDSDEGAGREGMAQGTAQDAADVQADSLRRAGPQAAGQCGGGEPPKAATSESEGVSAGSVQAEPGAGKDKEPLPNTKWELHRLIEEFIQRAPRFEGDAELARKIDAAIGRLE